MVLKNFFLGVISFFLVVLLILTVVLTGVNSLLYPTTYFKVFEKNDVYNSILSEENISEVSPFIEIPKGGMEELINPLITEFFSYMRGDTDKPNLTIKIDNQAIASFFEKSAKNFRVCNVNEEPFDSEGNPVCRPQDKNSTQFLYEVLERQNVTILAESTVDLTDVYGLNGEELNGVRDGIILYQKIYHWMIFFGLFLVALVLLISKSNLFMGLRWAGADFLISGIFVLVLGLTGYGLIFKFIPIGDIGLSFAENIAQDLALAVTTKIKIYSLALIAIGASLFGLSFFRKKGFIKRQQSLSK